MVEYRIPYLGLRIGIHKFEFVLNDAFFAYFGQGEIKKGRIEVKLILDRQASMMVLDFQLGGSVVFPCDRCGEEADIDVSGKEKLVVKMGDRTGSTDEEVLELGPNEHEIDLSQYLYEYAHLMLPARRVHKKLSDCNQEVIQHLGQSDEDDTAPQDPRWDALKNLNTN
jgi:uncharacterized metal-binding protein YceD (DUF177 family)